MGGGQSPHMCAPSISSSALHFCPPPLPTAKSKTPPWGSYFSRCLSPSLALQSSCLEKVSRPLPLLSVPPAAHPQSPAVALGVPGPRGPSLVLCSLAPPSPSPLRGLSASSAHLSSSSALSSLTFASLNCSLPPLNLPFLPGLLARSTAPLPTQVRPEPRHPFTPSHSFVPTLAPPQTFTSFSGC